MKKILITLFMAVCRKLEGTYLTRFKPIGHIYTKIFYSLKPKAVSLEAVGEHKMFLDLGDTSSMRMYMFRLTSL
ncbi:MAG: hypothetical protein NT120_00935 [Candidatus Aenigmarchaeota archaeon]|nr:hypothetical protein [Candidatus Aenigmarchaeota archaeon]